MANPRPLWQPPEPWSEWSDWLAARATRMQALATVEHSSHVYGLIWVTISLALRHALWEALGLPSRVML
ncbi:MAG: hypothetical protein KatS3mg109_2031 [Pirellulaceae bacterium]|nr:MAG: hypothetical protein KatS3mg109_2031 [Pirellulaceae bacterium]